MWVKEKVFGGGGGGVPISFFVVVATRVERSHFVCLAGLEEFVLPAAPQLLLRL